MTDTDVPMFCPVTKQVIPEYPSDTEQEPRLYRGESSWEASQQRWKTQERLGVHCSGGYVKFGAIVFGKNQFGSVCFLHPELLFIFYFNIYLNTSPSLHFYYVL